MTDFKSQCHLRFQQILGGLKDVHRYRLDGCRTVYAESSPLSRWLI